MSLRLSDHPYTAKRALEGAVYTPEAVLVIVCATLAMCNAFELLCLIFMTFKRRSGLYFWSILLASFGVIPYCVGWLIVYFDFTHDYVGMIIDSVGWVLLVSGQSVVLYSRLHLVVTDARILRGVLCMIVINGVVWHTSITVLLFGSTYSPNKSKRGFNAVFNVLEKVQMTCFCIQEFIISGLYIWKTIGILKTAFGNTRRVLWQLFAINIVIVIMDIALLAIEYKNYFVWQQGIKVVIYSIKLKLEFAVLGELIDFIRHRGGTQSGSNRDYRNTGAFVELSAHKPGKDKKTATMTDPTRDDLESNTVIVASKGSPLGDGSGDEIRVVTRVDDESLNVDPRDDRSTDELYHHTIAKSTAR
ncbi:uncharacterized protein NECHADRAFT_51153 [Fusarium vanettenii 77-13-4]|uniref:DUF7703 domain-containing protein n=1 Tax=Fusarium vanettenii (strain ATCC MYA-4622 / CBS 123669 / FGSC 9596 / NRRL 45880 / 77-13-4) TaxID=660122 RepID=C7ZKQ2_FUSV7|nr:uncharacterized protein NECHADRAFT_51153 [Fusarium vanettenii 77-13-4]EEU35483.1 hypothetical protein NECHADRAFT_51153 [Fusarium vanettenii 77-13-4]